jgi:hypothetical protein
LSHVTWAISLVTIRQFSASDSTSTTAVSYVRVSCVVTLSTRNYRQKAMTTRRFRNPTYRSLVNLPPRTWKISMTHAKHAPYLPSPFMDQEQHRLLYRDKMATDEFDLECELPPTPISPDMSEEAVYQLLPTAPDFEYGGFITENLIRYQKCESTFASTVESEACIWHSHPTDAPKADMPSCSDIYTFLTNRTFRAVTAAKTKI